MSIRQEEVHLTAERIIADQYPEKRSSLESDTMPGRDEALAELAKHLPQSTRTTSRITLVEGPGAEYLNFPFLHPSPAGGRFSERNMGAFYAAQERHTSVLETMHHRMTFMTGEPEQLVDVAVLQMEINGTVHDLRGLTGNPIYNPNDYTASQELARQLRLQESQGVMYSSVRHCGGVCYAIFDPILLSNCRVTARLSYVWDGERFSGYFKKGDYVSI